MARSLDAAQVERVRESLGSLWREDDFYDGVARALRPLIDGAEVYVLDFVGEDRHPSFLGSTRDLEEVERLPWVADGLVRRYVDEQHLWRNANRPVSMSDLRAADAAGASTFAETFLRPSGACDQLRVVFADPDGLLGFFGFYRDAPFREGERSALASIVSVLRDHLRVRRALETRAVAPGTLTTIVDAVVEPALIIEEGGRIVYANAAARCFEGRPPWIGGIEEASRKGAIRVVPLRLVDGSWYRMVLCDPVSVPVERAHETAWARRWKLPPRHARVAALLLRGLTDKEIAVELDRSVNTVRTYVRQVFRSVDVHGRAELVRVLRSPTEP